MASQRHIVGKAPHSAVCVCLPRKALLPSWIRGTILSSEQTLTVPFRRQLHIGTNFRYYRLGVYLGFQKFTLRSVRKNTTCRCVCVCLRERERERERDRERLINLLNFECELFQNFFQWIVTFMPELKWNFKPKRTYRQTALLIRFSPRSFCQ